jgi:hypothetical protein
LEGGSEAGKRRRLGGHPGKMAPGCDGIGRGGVRDREKTPWFPKAQRDSQPAQKSRSGTDLGGEMEMKSGGLAKRWTHCYRFTRRRLINPNSNDAQRTLSVAPGPDF